MADIIAFRVFVALAAATLSTASGLTGAWLLSLALTYPLRMCVSSSARNAPSFLPRFQEMQSMMRPGSSSAAALGTLLAAAVSSSLVFVLAMLVLKLELQERGDAPDAARFAWHIATFYLGAAFAPCAAAAGDVDFDSVPIGNRWTLLGFMYGARAVAIPPRCPPAATRTTANNNNNGSPTAVVGTAPSSGARAGLVFAADGSQAKYADAVYVALHNIRVLQASPMPVEVFHVGQAEAFSDKGASQLRSFGSVDIVDMLSRLHPDIRDVASSRLRSFAAKPFALLASSFDVAILVDANALFFQPPEILLTLASYRATGVQLFNDYVRSYHIVDPWLISGYLGDGEGDVAAYRSMAQGAECDSSVVVVDKTRAWRYLHVVAALNWWKALSDRHMWGDKDTWALAAIALWRGGGGSAQASSVGSTVGWLTRAAPAPAEPTIGTHDDAASSSKAPRTPTAAQPVWGHVQFDGAVDASNSTALLYINWQPHYAAGFIEIHRGEPAPVDCCVMLKDHWAGPHDEAPVRPTISPSGHARALQATFADARAALDAVGAEMTQPPHWWGQVRYRRCFIYFAVMTAGVAFAVWSAVSALRDGRVAGPRHKRTRTGPSIVAARFSPRRPSVEHDVA